MEEFEQVIVILIILAIFIGVSQSVGQGGGPIINVCLMVGLGYSTKKSISYSYVIMVGASLASILQNYVKSNKKNQSSIDFDLILVTLPMMLSGSIVGIVLKQFMSQLIKTIFLTILLTSLIIKSFKNYQKTIRQQKLTNQKQSIEEQSVLIIEDQSLQLTQINKKKKKQFQAEDTFCNILIIVFIIGYTVLIELIRGGRKFQSIFGYQPCKLQYWICNGLHILLSFIISFSVASKHEKNQKQNDNFFHFIMTGFFAGMAGGALGLGGATVLVPSWLTLGLQANKVVSNSIPLIFSTSLSLFFVSLISRNYQTEQVCYFILLAFVSSFIIRRMVEWIVQKFQIKSAVYLILIFILIVSLFVLQPYQIQKYTENPDKFLQFGEFC